MSNYRFFLYCKAHLAIDLRVATRSCAKLRVVLRNFYVNLRFTRKSLFKLNLAILLSLNLTLNNTRKNGTTY